MFYESTGVTIGGCFMVAPEVLAAKDREIERLKELVRSISASPDEWKAKHQAANLEILAMKERIRSLEHDNKSLKERAANNVGGRDHGLRIALNAAKAENQHLKRLMNDRGTYDTSMIESFDERTPEELAKFVEFELANGGKTSFAAACLVLMWLKYEQQKAANQITCERIANAADAINRLHDEIAAD